MGLILDRSYLIISVVLVSVLIGLATLILTATIFWTGMLSPTPLIAGVISSTLSLVLIALAIQAPRIPRRPQVISPTPIAEKTKTTYTAKELALDMERISRTYIEPLIRELRGIREALETAPTWRTDVANLLELLSNKVPRGKDEIRKLASALRKGNSKAIVEATKQVVKTLREE